jgi:hypothetical protein
MKIQLLHMFNVTNIPILKFQNLHHKLSISWNFNRYCAKFIKQYVCAKSIGFKCKNGMKRLCMICVFLTYDVLIWSAYDLHFN